MTQGACGSNPLWSGPFRDPGDVHPPPPAVGGLLPGKLTARLEQWDNQIITVELPWTDTDLGRDAFSGVLDTGDYVGLVWYTFQLETITGRRWNIKEEYQLTVYDGERDRAPAGSGRGELPDLPRPLPPHRVPDPAGAGRGALSTRAGRRSRSTDPTPAGRSATGTSSGGRPEGA